MTDSRRGRRTHRRTLIRGAAALGAAGLAAAVLPVLAWAHPGSPVPQAAAASTAAVTGDAVPVDPAVLAAEKAAIAKAKATNSAVAVDALTDATSQTVANADGTLTLTQNATPVRVRRGSAWTAVDTNLAKRADGTVAPAATDTDVAFSGGGKSALVTMTRDGKKLSITWPAALPTPTIAGDTATYADVLPGVDLAMTAHVDGFGEVLVVKTAAAAASPALATLRFGITAQGLTLNKDADGTETATDAAGKVLFRADTPVMWDSTDTAAPSVGQRVANAAALAAPKGSPASSGLHLGGSQATNDSATTTTPAPAPAGIDPSDVRHPGPAAHVSRLGMAFTAGTLTLTPDPAMLTGPDRVLPLYIDPYWSGSPSVQAWASISSNGLKSTTGTEARVGYDDWSGCGSYCGSINRSYFEMSDSGFQGATVTQAYFYPYFSWAADSTPEITQVWLDPDFPSNLSWSNKPTGSSPSTFVTQVSSCAGHGTSGCSAGTVKFDVTPAAKISAGGGRRDLEVDALDESNDLQWKHVDPSQTSWTVTYFRAPYLNTTYTTTPKVTGPGGTFVNSKNVTMLVTGGDTDGENVRSGYEIWNWVSGAATTNVANGLFSSPYTATGGAYTYSGLADGTYAWRGVTNSALGDLWSGWSPWQVFTVDTTPPPTPTVEAPQFPADELGGSYTDTGKFTLSTQGQDNVAGFIFSLDGDLGTTVWSQSSQPATWAGGTIVRGTQYWAPISSGNATVSFTPLTIGVHRLYAKAVDQAGLTSATEATYQFYAGLTTPSYAYGDQLGNGCATANTCNGNTVAVPAAQATVTAGASVVVQSDCCNVHFGDGKQVMLANGTGKVAVGDSAVYSFNVPSAGIWDVGANLTSASDYGQYTLTLDKGAAAQSVLVTNYDAYSSLVGTAYHDYGVVKNSLGAPIQLAAGLHTVTVTITGKNASSGGYQAGIDVIRLAPQSATCTITDLSACANNVAISSDANHLAADADGYGSSLSAGQLHTAGWDPGTPITVDGAPMTLPSYAVGKADNVLSSGQTVNVPTGYPNNGNAVEFLAFGTEGQVTGASGTITYSGTCNSSSTQSFTIDSVPDWVDTASAAKRVIGFASVNKDYGTQAVVPQLYAVSVPLTCPGQAVASISLPVVSDKALQQTTALHILAMGIRASSYTNTSDSQNWTGTYAAAVDAHLGTLGAQTVRLPVHLSISGSSLRLRLSNATGTVPAVFDHVTVAAQSSGAIPGATPTDVLVNGLKTITIPAGGEIVSDPLPFATTGQETLLVSLHLTTGDTDVVGHSSAQTTGWTAAAGTDATADTTGTPFTTTITTVDWLAGIDVTSPGATVGSLVLFGDQTVNADTATNDGQHHLSDTLAGKLASSNGGTVPYGVLSEGTNSWTQSNNLLPILSTSATNTVPPSVLGPADGRVLDDSNVRTVLISTGMSDILAGGTATAIENKLAALSEQIRHCYTDNATNYNVNLNNAAGLITVYIATIPPNATALTTGQEAVREAVNAWILTKTSGGAYANGHADGAIDFAAAVSNTGTDLGTTVNTAYLYNTVNPNDLYYSALAQQYVTNTATPPAATNTVTYQPMIMR